VCPDFSSYRGLVQITPVLHSFRTVPPFTKGGDYKKKQKIKDEKIKDKGGRVIIALISHLAECVIYMLIIYNKSKMQEAHKEEHMTGVHINNSILVLMAVAVVSSIGFGITEARAEDVLCDDMRANIGQLQQEDEKLKKEEKEARNKASDVYKQLHSYTWEGTGKTLANIAAECQSGEGDKAFCKGNMERFNEMMSEQKSANLKMKWASNKRGENDLKLKSLKSQAKRMGCDLGTGEMVSRGEHALCGWQCSLTI